MKTAIKHRELRRNILRDTDLIPTLPEVIVKVIALLNEADTEPEAIEEVLRLDPALVARLLGMVNSPFFGMRRQISSIKDAIMVLGYQNLRSLVMVTSTSKFLGRDFESYGHETRGLWRHSVSVAAAAKGLATAVGEDPIAREGVFIAALLHDIGKMVLHTHLSRFTDVQIMAFETICEAETELLGMTHAEAGILVADKWNLDALVGDVLLGHHDRSIETEHPRQVAMVRLADAVAHLVGAGYLEGRAPVPEFDAGDIALLGLTVAEFEELQPSLVEDIELTLNHLA